MGRPPSDGDSLLEVAVAILEEPTADVKAQWTHIAAELWREGRLTLDQSDEGKQPLLPPDKPARDAQVIFNTITPPSPNTHPTSPPTHPPTHPRHHHHPIPATIPTHTLWAPGLKHTRSNSS